MTQLLLLFLVSLNIGTAFATDPRHLSVELSARVQQTSPTITLSWTADPLAVSYTIYRKTVGDSSWGNAIADLPGAATTFADFQARAFLTYEYQVTKLLKLGPWPGGNGSEWKRGFGYIAAGYSAPLIDLRGKIVLIIENSIATALVSELDRLQSDLIGDGWIVVRHVVSRTDSIHHVKQLIRGEFTADPLRLKAALLVGRIPVPYSGDIFPDFHPTHRGAWPADTFYGDMDGQWTDASVQSTGSQFSRNHNRPGDGKFDQSVIPSMLEVAVGRLDFSELSAFQPVNEIELTRRYLTKTHLFRHNRLSIPRRALIRDNFGLLGDDAPVASGWRNFAPLVAPANIRVVSPNAYLPTLEREPFLLSFGAGGGDVTQADGVGTTFDLAKLTFQSAFTLLYGSWFGDWDTQNNFLRAALASSGYCMASIWAGTPHWFLHHLGAGETIGFSALQTQNNDSVYRNQVNDGARMVHVALLGDPTLRLHPVTPPNSFRAARSSSGVFLSWNPSSDAILGYIVYRANSPTGPFSRIVRGVLNKTTFTDGTVSSGSYAYMVRAVKLESTSSGSYLNPSQGIFSAIDLGGIQQRQLQLTTIPTASTLEDTPIIVTINLEDSYNDASSLHLRATSSNQALVMDESVQISTSTEGNRLARILPKLDAAGETTVTFTVTDGTAVATQPLRLSVLPVNDPPLAADDRIAVFQNQTVPIAHQSLLANDRDPDSQETLRVIAVSENSSARGSLRLDPNLIAYTPKPGFLGADSFSYTLGDSAGASSTAQVLVQVYDTPRIALRILSGNKLEFIAAVPPNQSFSLYRSSNLRSWEPVGSYLSGDGNVFTFQSNFTDREREQFFRLTVP